MYLDFPDPETADENGIVCWGGELTPPYLEAAYQKGIFPWPHEGHPLLWFSPDPRGILFCKDLHIPKSLRKWIRQNPEIRYSWSEAKSQVIANCKTQVRKAEQGTWITEDLQRAYAKWEKAYSFEAWRQDQLIAGLFGVKIKNFMSGESMFHAEDNASKALLVRFSQECEKLKIPWIDIQMCTPVSHSLGAKYLPRKDYLALLAKALE